MGLYEIGECSYCDKKNKILRPTPFVADYKYKAMMCEHCWNDTDKEYENLNGEYISDFKSNKEEYEKFNKMIFKGKNIQELINYLESIKEQSGGKTEVRVDGQVIADFEDYIDVDHVRDYIDFVTPSFISM